MTTPRRILILRRENIGDLVCTTPLIAALRARFPDAKIALLANSYNAPVVENNPHLDAVYAYTKGKHAGSAWGAARAHLKRFRLLLSLRGMRFDDVVLADPSYIERNIRLARFLTGGRTGTRVIGFADFDGRREGLDQAFARVRDEKIHIVDLIFRLAAAWDLPPPPPACLVVAKSGVVPDRPSRVGPGSTVGVHISARQPSQRWSAERFADAARGIHQAHRVRFKLFWSPGDESNPQHPGDDDKAGEILALLRDLDIEAVPTLSLHELITGLADCQAVVCADGGAMHIAAGLGKPIVCLFGVSDAVRWRPWSVPCQLLQTESRQVMDIPAIAVVQAFDALQKSIA